MCRKLYDLAWAQYLTQPIIARSIKFPFKEMVDHLYTSYGSP